MTQNETPAATDAEMIAAFRRAAALGQVSIIPDPNAPDPAERPVATWTCDCGARGTGDKQAHVERFHRGRGASRTARA